MAIHELSNVESRREFVRRNHTCVIGYARSTGLASMSIVHYVMDGDDIVFLTMAARQKAKAVRRLGRLSVCVLAGHPGGLAWPPEYLVVDGKATLDSDLDRVVQQALRIAPIMTGKELPAQAIPIVREMMKRENRVIIRVAPESTFHSPAVHPENEAQVIEAGKSGKAVHGLGSRLPWNGPE